VTQKGRQWVDSTCKSVSFKSKKDLGPELVTDVPRNLNERNVEFC
jgi:hypothetical protein